jgi:hypothetical protein
MTARHGEHLHEENERPFVGISGVRAFSCLAYDAGVKRINCVCGVVLEGDDDDELWEKAQAHVRADHPELVGKVSREDILAQAEEA